MTCFPTATTRITSWGINENILSTQRPPTLLKFNLGSYPRKTHEWWWTGSLVSSQWGEDTGMEPKQKGAQRRGGRHSRAGLLTLGLYLVLTVPWLLLSLFSRSVMHDSFWPHGLKHSRLPCPLLSSGVDSNLRPLNWWCHLTISSCCPFSCLRIRVFSSESALCIRWQKCWIFFFFYM